MGRSGEVRESATPMIPSAGDHSNSSIHSDDEEFARLFREAIGSALDGKHAASHAEIPQRESFELAEVGPTPLNREMDEIVALLCEDEHTGARSSSAGLAGSRSADM